MFETLFSFVFGIALILAVGLVIWLVGFSFGLTWGSAVGLGILGLFFGWPALEGLQVALGLDERENGPWDQTWGLLWFIGFLLLGTGPFLRVSQYAERSSCGHLPRRWRRLSGGLHQPAHHLAVHTVEKFVA
jgi:hypothetical protein